MKKGIAVISTMLVCAMTLVGCATRSDLQQVKTQEMQTSVKADQALQAAQDANATASATKAETTAQLEQANTAATKAAEAATRAENALKMAEERAMAAEEKTKAAEEKGAGRRGKDEEGRCYVQGVDEEVNSLITWIIALLSRLREGGGRVFGACRFFPWPFNAGCKGVYRSWGRCGLRSRKAFRCASSIIRLPL